MNKTWEQIVQSFSTIPFFFVGSGLTRRYYNLPSWQELLTYFANRISNDAFSFQSYLQSNNNNYEKAGQAIEHDFNKKWFETPDFRTNSVDILESVQSGTSPFKAEVAYYIKENSQLNTQYSDEINLLRELTTNNISGFITTNYDTFLETIAPEYKVYVGQEELIFSAIQEIGEIFKIHGSITLPSSIVITDEDYKNFDAKCAYLAAKLMTIFMEYPIIFIGYSVNDANIRKILQSIVTCLSQENMQKLTDRFIFIKHNSNINDHIDISYQTMVFDKQKSIVMTQLETNNFKLIFEALKEKRAGLPVRILRLLKDEFYNYTITHSPTKHVYVSAYDPNISDDQICFSIGQDSHTVIKGLVGITAEQWYKDVLLGNILPFSADDILTHAFQKLVKSNNTLPIFKYLSQAQIPHTDILEKNKVNNFDDLISSYYKKHRNNSHITDRTVNGIRNANTVNNIIDPKAVYYLQFLSEDEILVNDLEKFLKDYIQQTPDILSENFKESNQKSMFKRLIRIYDWLKYHK